MCSVPVDGNILLAEATLAGHMVNVISSDGATFSVSVRGCKHSPMFEGNDKDAWSCEGGKLGFLLVLYAYSGAVQQLDGYDT